MTIVQVISRPTKVTITGSNYVVKVNIPAPIVSGGGEGETVFTVGVNGDYPATRAGLQAAVNAALALPQWEEATEYPADSSGKTCSVSVGTLNNINKSVLTGDLTNFLTTLTDQRGRGHAEYIEITVGTAIRIEPILTIIDDTKIEIPKWMLAAVTNVSFRLVKPIMHVIKVMDALHLSNALDADVLVDPTETNEAIYISTLGTGESGVDSHIQAAALRVIFDNHIDAGVRFESWVVSGIVEWIGGRTVPPRMFRIHGDREDKSVNTIADDPWIKYPHVNYYLSDMALAGSSGVGLAEGIWFVQRVFMDAVHNTINAASSWLSTTRDCHEKVKTIDPSGNDNVVGREWLTFPGMTKKWEDSVLEYHHMKHDGAAGTSSLVHVVGLKEFHVGGIPQSTTNRFSKLWFTNIQASITVNGDIGSLSAYGLQSGLAVFNIFGVRASEFNLENFHVRLKGDEWVVVPIFAPAALLSMRNITFVDAIAGETPVEFNFNNCSFPPFETDWDYDKFIITSFKSAERVRAIAINSGTGIDDGLGLDILQGNTFFIDAEIDTLASVSINTVVNGVPNGESIKFKLKARDLVGTSFIFGAIYNGGSGTLTFDLVAKQTIIIEFVSTFDGSFDSFSYLATVTPT